MRLHLAVFALALGLSGVAQAQELRPLDLADVDPDLVGDMFGTWEIRDLEGGKSCKVVLKRDEVIGGMQIDVDPACPKVFPVMGDIAAWRLMDGWAIDLVDAERKLRIRFTTPDLEYVASPETDGIFTIVPLPKG